MLVLLSIAIGAIACSPKQPEQPANNVPNQQTINEQATTKPEEAQPATQQNTTQDQQTNDNLASNNPNAGSSNGNDDAVKQQPGEINPTPDQPVIDYKEYKGDGYSKTEAQKNVHDILQASGNKVKKTDSGYEYIVEKEASNGMVCDGKEGTRFIIEYEPMCADGTPIDSRTDVVTKESREINVGLEDKAYDSFIELATGMHVGETRIACIPIKDTEYIRNPFSRAHDNLYVRITLSDITGDINGSFNKE